MANALTFKFKWVLFKSDENKITEEGMKKLLRNKWSKLKFIGLSSYLTI